MEGPVPSQYGVQSWAALELCCSPRNSRWIPRGTVMRMGEKYIYIYMYISLPLVELVPQSVMTERTKPLGSYSAMRGRGASPLGAMDSLVALAGMSGVSRFLWQGGRVEDGTCCA